jgi:hypothetical protein
MSIMKLGLLGLVMTTSVLTGLLAPATPTRGHAAETAAVANYRFSGSCTIRCTDGRCEVFCSAGSVAAFDLFDPSSPAVHNTRAAPASRGTVIEGTVSVTVDLNLNDEVGYLREDGRLATGLGLAVSTASATTNSNTGFLGFLQGTWIVQCPHGHQDRVDDTTRNHDCEKCGAKAVDDGTAKVVCPVGHVDGVSGVTLQHQCSTCGRQCRRN